MNKWEKTDQEVTENNEEETEFGCCEICEKKLDYLPSGGWGVGYVCVSCARELRGEYE